MPDWLRGFYQSLEEDGLSPEQLQQTCQLAALQHRAAEETEAPTLYVRVCTVSCVLTVYTYVLLNWLLFNECRCVCTLPSGPSYIVWLLCCRKQVGGQIPVHLASQLKPQQWTETVGRCFQKVKELSALEAKRKFIGNPPLAQTVPRPSCSLLSLSPSSSPVTADIISSYPLYGSRFFPATVGNCAHAQPVHVTALLVVHFLLVCISFLCRV